MFSLRDLRFVLFSLAQRIMGFFILITHKPTRSETPVTWHCRSHSSNAFTSVVTQVGLAVGDIEAIRKTAFLSNKARKIDFVTEFEDSLPECIARRLYRPQVCEDDAKPDQKKCGKFLE